MRDIRDILPIWSVESDVILSKMGDMTIGYKLELPEIFSLGEQQLENFHQAWVKAVRMLPAGVVMCKQDWFAEARYKADLSEKTGFLERSNEKHFAERPYLEHDCYLLLTYKPRNRVIPNSAMSTLLRKHLVPMELLDDRLSGSFNAVCEQFCQVLIDSGCVKIERLKNAGLKQLINRYLTLDNDGVIRDLSFENAITIGEQYCTLFSVSDEADMPNTCASVATYEKYSTDKHKFPIGFSLAIGPLLSCNHIYSQYLFIEDTTAVVKKLESKKLRLQSLSAYSRENAIARDAVNEFLNETIGLHRQPVRAHFNVLAWTDKKEDIGLVRNLCAGALAKLDVRPRIETVGGPQIWWAGIPGNAADLPINDTFLTFSQQACCFLNMETNYRSSAGGAGIRLCDRVSGRPLDIDLWDEPMRLGLITNRNMIIVGPSGSGKSFNDNHMLFSYHAQGAHIVVVDMGNSYAGLCELLDGYYYTYTDQRPLALNPFYLANEGPPDTEKKESLKTLLVALWKKEDELFVRSEYVALSNALQIYYERPVSFRCFNSFYEFVRDDFVGVLGSQGVTDKEFDVSNFLYVMRPFYKGGEFDFLLNATDGLDVLENRFIVFEIDTIKDHPILFPVVTLIIMDLFIQKMRKLPGIRKIIVIEEAWKAIAKKGMADYVKYLFKTIRKYYGKSVVVTQDLDDILSSEIIKQTIINNADLKVLLDQSKYQHRFHEVQQLLGLPDSEVPKVLSLNKANDPSRKYKEVYIWPLGKVYGVEVSREAHLCYTTEESEKVKVQEAARKYGSLEKGIKSLVMIVVLFISIGLRAQVPVVGEIVGAVIKAVDLKIQKLQSEQLWLQQVQKQAENKLHELSLAEIRGWSDKQKRLYQGYFDELKGVRTIVVNITQLDSLRRQIRRQ